MNDKKHISLCFVVLRMHHLLANHIYMHGNTKAKKRGTLLKKKYLKLNFFFCWKTGKCFEWIEKKSEKMHKRIHVHVVCGGAAMSDAIQFHIQLIEIHHIILQTFKKIV